MASTAVSPLDECRPSAGDFSPFPKDIVLHIVSFLYFPWQVCLFGTCKSFHDFGLHILHASDFEQKKDAVLLSRLSSSKLWKYKEWLLPEILALKYDKLCYNFKKRIGISVTQFVASHPETFLVQDKKIWNVALFGSPDKYCSLNTLKLCPCIRMRVSFFIEGT
jgi:hypothetical protein